MYRKVKRLYDLGLYTAEQVKDFADRGKISPEQYEEITGIPYINPKTNPETTIE